MQSEQKGDKREMTARSNRLNPTEYNLELAIEARRVLMLEAHNWEDCLKLVYKPTQELLEKLTEEEPEFLLCFSGKPYTYPKPGFPPDKGGASVDLYIVGPEKRIAYLGTALDREESHVLWQWFLENFPNQETILRKRGPMSVVRQRIRCRIPVDCDWLNREAMKRAVLKYMKTFCLPLACIPIRWLPTKEQKALENRIKKEAKARAKPQTKEEEMRIFGSDAN